MTWRVLARHELLRDGDIVYESSEPWAAQFREVCSLLDELSCPPPCEEDFVEKSDNVLFPASCLGVAHLWWCRNGKVAGRVTQNFWGKSAKRAFSFWVGDRPEAHRWDHVGRPEDLRASATAFVEELRKVLREA